MESNDVNQDHLLEAALKGSASTPLPDNGFSQRVLRQLPRPESNRPWYAVDATQLTLWAAGFAVALVLLGQSSVNAEVTPLFQTLNDLLSGLWGPLGIATVILTSIYGLGGWTEKSRD